MELRRSKCEYCPLVLDVEPEREGRGDCARGDKAPVEGEGEMELVEAAVMEMAECGGCASTSTTLRMESQYSPMMVISTPTGKPNIWIEDMLEYSPKNTSPEMIDTMIQKACTHSINVRSSPTRKA